jgi:hypothetical protein
MITKTPEALEMQIEQLVREYLAAQQMAARVAVERAFGAAVAAPRSAARKRAVHSRRGPTEMAGLAERLFDAVRACPGETIAVIAARVGENPKALQRPMLHLKNSGRVRSAGERNLTRYFPMVVAKSA